MYDFAIVKRQLYINSCVDRWEPDCTLGWWNNVFLHQFHKATSRHVGGSPIPLPPFLCSCGLLCTLFQPSVSDLSSYAHKLSFPRQDLFCCFITSNSPTTYQSPIFPLLLLPLLHSKDCPNDLFQCLRQQLNFAKVSCNPDKYIGVGERRT